MSLPDLTNNQSIFQRISQLISRLKTNFSQVFFESIRCYVGRFPKMKEPYNFSHFPDLPQMR